MNARALNFAGLAIVGVLGVAFLLLTPQFADLDTVCPPNVRVLAIKPTINAQGGLFLDMQVAADSPEPEEHQNRESPTEAERERVRSGDLESAEDFRSDAIGEPRLAFAEG